MMNEDTIERLQADHDARVAAIREFASEGWCGPRSKLELEWLLADNALVGMALVNERAAREAAQARLAKADEALETVISWLDETRPDDYQWLMKRVDETRREIA
jgi:hypothetical protein